MKIIKESAMAIAALSLIALPVLAANPDSGIPYAETAVSGACSASGENFELPLLAKHDPRRDSFEQQQREEREDFERQMDQIRQRMKRQGRSKGEIHERLDPEYRDFEEYQRREREAFDRGDWNDGRHHRSSRHRSRN